MNKPYTKQQEAVLLAEYPKGTSTAEIGRMIDRSARSVELAAAARKIKRSPSYLRFMRAEVSRSRFGSCL